VRGSVSLRGLARLAPRKVGGHIGNSQLGHLLTQLSAAPGGLFTFQESTVRIEMQFSIAHSAAPREIIRLPSSDVLVLIARNIVLYLREPESDGSLHPEVVGKTEQGTVPRLRQSPIRKKYKLVA
jgi:hypothetical protein